MRPTERVYKDLYTNESFRMYKDDITDNLMLINEKTGERVKSFYLAAFTPMAYRLRDKTEVYLCTGQFVKADKNNMATHQRFFMKKRFKKI